MLMKTRLNLVLRTVVFGMAAIALVAGEAQAKGGTKTGADSGGRGGSSSKYVLVPGVCKGITDAVADGVLTKANNLTYFGVQMTGTKVGGDWFIRFMKNGVVTSDNTGIKPYTFEPVGGWVVIGSATTLAEKGTTVTFSAEATSLTTGEVCNVNVGIKI
jgi:hypothetical protein